MPHKVHPEEIFFAGDIRVFANRAL